MVTHHLAKVGHAGPIPVRRLFFSLLCSVYISVAPSPLWFCHKLMEFFFIEVKPKQYLKTYRPVVGDKLFSLYEIRSRIYREKYISLVFSSMHSFIPSKNREVVIKESQCFL